MKRFILLGIISIFALSGYSQELYKGGLLKYNNSLSFGIYSGLAGKGQKIENPIFGFSLSAYGIYIDYMFLCRDRDKYIFDGLGNNRSENFHIGYQIPISNWMKITPVIGYSFNENRGEYLYTFSPYSTLQRIATPRTMDEGFDFGINAGINLFSNENVNFTMNGIFTKYCLCCGFNVNIIL